METLSSKSIMSRDTSSTNKNTTNRSSKLKILNINDFITGSSLFKNSFNNSPKSNDSSIIKNINRRSLTETDIELPMIHTSQFSPLIAKKNEGFLKRKIVDIHNSSIEKINKIYRTELSLNTEPSTPLSSSKENLTKSVLKRLSSKLSETEGVKNREKIYIKGEIGVEMSKIFCADKFNSLAMQKKLTGEKIRESFDAYAKTENERIMRLLQKQEELEQKFSSIRKNIKRHVEKDKKNRLSKKDFYLYSQSLAAREMVK